MEGESDGQDQREEENQPLDTPTISVQPSSDSHSEPITISDEATSEKPPSQQQTETENEDTPTNIPTTAMAEEGAGGGQSSREMPTSSRPHSSNSSARAKSSASGEIVFEAKKKKKRGGSAAPDDAYTVTFTVSIAMAIPTEMEDRESSDSRVEDEDQPDLKDILRKKKRVFEAPRAQNYYHAEYYLIPEEDELIKTDVVTYGMAAKLYMERHDARVIKTWQDGEITWIAWAHSHTMTVTKDMLLKMYDHTLELRVWDTKDKCSTRARFDRPKAFRLPQPKPGESPEDVGGVKAMVTKQMTGFSKMQSPKAESVRPLPQRCAYPRADTKRRVATALGVTNSHTVMESASGKALVAVPNKGSSRGPSGQTFSRLGKLAGSERSLQSPGGKDSKTSKGSLSAGDNRSNTLLTPKPPPPPGSNAASAKSGHSQSSPLQSRSHLRSGESEASILKDMILPEDSATVRRRQKKAEAAASASAEQAKKFGVCMVPFRMALLFSGMQSITSRLQQPVAGVEDLFITVSLDQPLLSEDQKRALNPMIITVKSVTDMPSSPMTFEELQSKCQPVYCKYQFFHQPFHSTVAKEHARNLYWDDKNVVLLGPLEPSELREYLSGPHMTVEVHDRDRKTEDVKLKATLFGDDLEDEKISNVGTVASRRTLHNAFEGRNKPWDPYGVCGVDLSELLLGHRFLQLSVPIHNCPLPDPLGLEGGGGGSHLMGVAGAVDGPVDIPLSSGGYQRSGAALKIQVELAHPLITTTQLAAKEELESTQQCPFGRIVFTFAYKNTTLLHQLQHLITTMNAKALDLDDMPQHVIDAALSTYKLSMEQQSSGTLDIVTGFHVLDKVKHIFVLEGLRDQAIKHLWEDLPTPENSDVRVLYNSDLSFSQRLYGALDVDLCRVKLHEPLELVVRQSLLYVRDMVPKPCFLALIRLEEVGILSSLCTYSLHGLYSVDLCHLKTHEPLELLVRQSLLYVRDMVPKPCFLALIRLEEVGILSSLCTYSLHGLYSVDLCHLKTHEPLELLVRQSLLYVRDMVPKPCFLALIRLEEVGILSSLCTYSLHGLYSVDLCHLKPHEPLELVVRQSLLYVRLEEVGAASLVLSPRFFTLIRLEEVGVLSSLCTYSVHGRYSVDLGHLKPHQPIEFVVRQSLLYVRDMVPKPCFLALIRLEEHPGLRIVVFRVVVFGVLSPCFLTLIRLEEVGVLSSLCTYSVHGRYSVDLGHLKPHQPIEFVVRQSLLYVRDMVPKPCFLTLIRLEEPHQPIESVVRQSLLYVRDMVPKPCFLALIRLEEISRMHLMKDVVKNNIFPTSDMVVSMSKEFGVPFTADDFEELRPDWEKSLVKAPAELQTVTPGVMVQMSRDWTPIDNFNKTFVDMMEERNAKGADHDFVVENKEGIKRTSDQNMLMREKTQVPLVQADVGKAHNYSTQTLNSTELANEALRNRLQQQQPNSRFTRSQDFHHSSTVVPVNVQALAKRDAQLSRSLWRTHTGWIYPGKKTMVEGNVHPKRPHYARVDELKEKWRENILHVGELQPTLDRDLYPWDYRRHDMELYCQPPPLFMEDPLSIHLPGVKQAVEKAEAKEKDAAEWQARVVVDDTALHVHRVLPQTEMTDAGFYSSNQMDRLTCLLKDPPHKFSLKHTHVWDMPPLSVVHYPAVDTLARLQGVPLPTAIPGEGEEKVTGYKPGPYQLSSWSMEDNRVPACVYNHPMYAERHGKDFDGLHKERQLLWKRPIVPLSETDRDNHLFKSPMDLFSQYQPLPAVGTGPREMVETMDSSTMTQDLPQSKVYERGVVFV
ncbi:hypothetical protein ACOMHN_039719 [Nucella lapillus]